MKKLPSSRTIEFFEGGKDMAKENKPREVEK
jgi:hypothetical protein